MKSLLAALILVLPAAACSSDPIICADSASSSLDITVTDATTGAPICAAVGHVLKTTPSVFAQVETNGFATADGGLFPPCKLILFANGRSQSVTFSLQVVAKGYQPVTLPDRTVTYGECGNPTTNSTPPVIPVALSPEP